MNEESIVASIVLLGAIFILFLLSFFIAYSAASSLCVKSEIVPVRYEINFFGGREQIQTTQQNSDEMAKVCIETYKASFWHPTENEKYVAEKSQGEKQ